MSEAYVRQHAAAFPSLLAAQTAYRLPYRAKQAPERVLILGAGSGNDVASALHNGAKQVTAVEIDPLIVELGRELHPDEPYRSPKVTVWTGDARSFIQRDESKYDLIVYGLVDSHTLLSSRSEIRLDNFLYTLESFRDARRLLKDDGALVLTFSIPREKSWLANRLFNMLREVFGDAPLCRETGYDRATTFMVGVRGYQMGPRWTACRDRLLAEEVVTLSDDDWPFLYLQRRAIPGIYFSVIVTALLLAALLIFLLVPEAKRLRGHFFFLGAAFMLVEVKAVTELALVFGTTWFVSSIAILGILVVALMANLWVQFGRRISLPAAYGLLMASLALGYLFPRSVWLDLGPAAGGVVAATLLSLPVFFAGIVFSTLLSRESSVESAFGSNLFGSMFGGFFEYVSLAVGVRQLYLVAAGFYGLALLFTRKDLGRL